MAFFKRIVLPLIIAATSFQSTAEGGLWDSVKSVFIAPEKPQAPMIKVLIAHDIDQANIEVRGKHYVKDPYKNDYLSTHYSSKKGVVEAQPTGLKWGEAYPGVYQLNIVPDHEKTIVVINGTPYKGEVYIYDIGGRISIINKIDIEDYLNSTLSGVTAQPWSDEALSATSIASRTHAYYLANNASNPYWHVRAEEVGYNGQKSVKEGTNVARAIKATKYMVMSQTGTYEGILTPFPVEVVTSSGSQTKGRGYSFSLDDAEYLAQRGDNAAKILTSSFPNTTIELNFYRDELNAVQHIAEKPPTRNRHSGSKKTFR